MKEKSTSIIVGAAVATSLVFLGRGLERQPFLDSGELQSVPQDAVIPPDIDTKKELLTIKIPK